MTNDKPPQALAATPAVGGEAVAYRWKYEDETDWTLSKTEPKHLFYKIICDPLYAAQPASPLRVRETFEAWFNSHFLDPDGGSTHLPPWLKDDLRSAWDAAAPPEQPHKIETDGPPCPTCGFKITSREPRPFIIEDDAPPEQPAAVEDSPIMRAAKNASKTIEGWSDAKREYAERVTAADQDKEPELPAARPMGWS